MKMIFKIALFILLISNSACSQNASKTIAGEWLLKTDYEAPDLIVFRSDNKYSVYNDMDFMGTESSGADIIFDNKSATAITETGKWIYDQTTNQLTLTERNFNKESSEFNRYHGKGEELVFKIKEITDKELVLCSVEKENSCDTYIKNANLTGKEDKIFYREVIEEYTGTGSQTKEILLSGYETELKLSYDFYTEADQLTITDKTGKELFSTDMTATNGRKTEEIPLRGVTKLVIKVKGSQESSKWKVKSEIK